MYYMVKKTLLVVSAIILLLLLGQLIFNNTYNFPQELQYGLSFSPKFAQGLGLDWKEVYIKTLDDLKVRDLRLPTYWDEVQTQSDALDFSKVDFMLDEAQRRGAKVILVLGARQPRWPECHIPSWAKQLPLQERQKKTLEFITSVVQRYKEYPAIFAWQVENEPLLRFFGEGCDDPDKDFLRKEVELVRSLSNKPIIVSDSGELGLWISPMKISDIFGTTLYRRVFNSVLGYTTYPIPPFLYNVKSALVKNIFAPGSQKTIIVELQAEPWVHDRGLAEVLLEHQVRLFSLQAFRENIEYAKDTGFDEVYLWGVEWWYYMEKMDHPEYLDFAKSLFMQN